MSSRICKNHLYLLFAAFLAAFLLSSLPFAPSEAQITRTARGELFDTSDRTSIGSYIYKTVDRDKRLTYQAVISRHEHNLRGKKQSRDIISLDPAPATNWLVFSITNNTKTQDWVLDFGHFLQGRFAQVNSLRVYNHSRGEQYRFDDKNIPYFMKSSTALFIKITPGRTESFVIRLAPKRGMPATINPSILTQDLYFQNPDLSHIGLLFLNIVLIAFIGGFAALTYMSKQKFYGLFCLYCGLHLLALALLPHIFINDIEISGELLRLLLPVLIVINLIITKTFLNIKLDDHTQNMAIFASGFLMLAAVFFSLIPMDELSYWQNIVVFISSLISLITMIAVTFSQGQKGHYVAYYYASALLIMLVGFLVSGLNIANIFIPSILGINFYWILLPAQIAFFMVASVRRIAFQQSEERDIEARDQRTAYSLARLQRSKESADQSRLLRVIERERELMAELREREIQRTDEMRKAKEAADEANKAKSAFLAVVSHEIRTPMTGIMGILKLLQGTHFNKEQGEYLLTIQKSGDTMIALLNDILDFEKIETGAMSLEEISVDIPKLAQGIITLMSGHVADKNIELKCEVSDNFPHLLIGDPTRLRQVLLNLVNNSIKFTESGSVTIILRATKLQDKPDGLRADYEVYFGIKDTGVGISKEAQETIFDPFQQADTSVTRKYGGSGLGLAICQRLITAMKSHIQIKSQEGMGATFYFSLLMQKSDASEEGEIGIGSSKSLNENYGRADKLINSTPPLHVEHQGDYVSDEMKAKQKSNPLNVMVIEDNEINRQVLKSFIENNGHNVILHESGEDAIAYIKGLSGDQRIDTIFTDINLTGMSGIEIARVVRDMENQDIANVPIIAVTGNVSEKEINKVKSEGFSGVIHKPIDYNKLVEILDDIYSNNFKSLLETTTSDTLKSIVAGDSLEDDDESLPDFGADHVSPLEAYSQGLKDGDSTKAQEEPSSKDLDDPSIDHSAIDHTMLKGLLNSLGKEQTVELLAGCMDKADEIIKALKDEDKSDDLIFLKDRAHELKGMTGNFGISNLAEISGRAEKAAEESDLAATLEHIKKLPDAYRRAELALQDWMDNN